MTSCQITTPPADASASREASDDQPPPPRYPYVHVDVHAADAEDVSGELWELGASGIEERDATTIVRHESEGTEVTLVASFADEAEAREAAEHLGERFRAHVEILEGDAWRDEWRRFFHPIRLGQRLFVRPSWSDEKAWDGDVVLSLDPGRAFGSGTHPTTRLVLRELDRLVRGGERVLDVGCGSGVLAVAALLLGADRVRGVDIDPAAIETSRDNARINRVASRLTVSTSPVGRLRGSYDIVVANIEAVPLLRHVDAIKPRVRPGGTLVLSGILVEERQRVIDAYRDDDFALRYVLRDGDWVALVLRRGG